MGLSACLLPSTDPTPRPGVRGGARAALQDTPDQGGAQPEPRWHSLQQAPQEVLCETLATLALASSPQTGREHSLGSGERRPADTRPAVRTTRAAALPRAPVAWAVVTVWQRECGWCHQATVWLTQDCGVPWWGRSVLPPGLPQETWEAGHH